MTPHRVADIEQMDVLELEKLVIQLATLYDQGDPCIDFDGDLVTDSQYDLLVRILKQRKPTSEAFAKGTTSPSKYDPDEGIKLVIHDPPMTSIDKADGTLAEKKEKHYAWVMDAAQELGYDLSQYDAKNPLFVQSYKHDGVAVRIYYEKGKLTKAGLRPRGGVKGIDVTENIKYVKGVPEKLPLPVTLAIGGELECLLDDFEAVNKALAAAGEKLRENPRNHTYGGINQRTDPSKTKDARISFTGYNIVGHDSHQYYQTELERAIWVNTVLKVPFVRVMPHHVQLNKAEMIGDCYQQLADMEANVSKLKYEVDGVVLKVNNLEDQEQLGHTGGDPTKEPKGALAWKFAEEWAKATISDIEWKASRTGRVPPVAVFKDPIRLAGTNVRRATLNNLGWMKRLGIGIGSEVKVIKAGKIIPKVVDVLGGTKLHGQQIQPIECPTCRSCLQVVPGNPPNVDLICENDDCPAKRISGIVFFLRMVEAKGLGESMVEQILEHGKVKELADIYKLTLQDLLDAGFSKREALLALATIHMVKPVKDDAKLALNISIAQGKKKHLPAWQFFAALGIPGAGKTAGKALIDAWKSFTKIMDAPLADLETVSGIGQTTAKSIRNYFCKNRDRVGRLLEHFELELPKTGKFSGKSFVLSGSFQEGKAHWEKAIADLGGKISGSVSQSTDYLVAGPGSGSKSDKAKQLGVRIIDVEELKKLL